MSYAKTPEEAHELAGRIATTRPADFTRHFGLLTEEVEAQIEDAFNYHRWSPAQEEIGAIIRSVLVVSMKQIVRLVPPCPDRSAALRKLREARMDCNSAITHSGKY